MKDPLKDKQDGLRAFLSFCEGQYTLGWDDAQKGIQPQADWESYLQGYSDSYANQQCMDGQFYD